MTVVCGKYEWDEKKCLQNIKKHGLDFAKILDVFDDPYFYEIYDEINSSANEHRYIGVGLVYGLMLIVTAYTERNGRTRIISARCADRKDKEKYYANQKRFEN